jgi:hypothetical protein
LPVCGNVDLAKNFSVAAVEKSAACCFDLHRS